MISLLEKEARDPVEVLRVKLKDSTDASLLNSQLLQEIKYDYQAKQDSTKGQLDAFVQAHVDEIERASTLLDVGDTVGQIVRNLEGLSQSCRKMNEELGEKKLSSGISVARRNLKELENQIVFYEEIPMKMQELHQLMGSRLGEVVSVYVKWQPFDDWRQKMLQELKQSAIDKSDELGNSKAQARILTSMGSRLEAIESVNARILSEVWGCMHHCVEIAQFNKKRLADAFHVLDLMEKRRRKLADSKREYLDNTLKPLSDQLHTSCFERCKTEIATHLTRRGDEMFRFAEKEAEQKGQKTLDTILNAANHLLMDLEIVQSDVVGCFPNEIDVMQLFTTTYNTLLENEISKICTRPDIGIAHRLQLVQWIEYYNSEIIKYKRARASGVLDQTSQVLMKLYLDQIQGQIHMWVTNIWKREEERVIGPHGELQSTRPNDIINILKSQISIGQEWLTGKLVGRVVVSCLEALMEQLKTRYESFAGKKDDLDVESLCSFINDTDILQAKCPELVEEISFAERDSEEKEAFDIFMGDALDTTSTEIVKLGVSTCKLIVFKIFSEVEHKWDEGEPVVENLLATLGDYYADLKSWISGSFFFSKVVRLCLDQCAKEYVKRLQLRTHCISNAQATAGIVENDLKNLVEFFSKFAADLRRAGIRSVDDIRKEFGSLQLICDVLNASGDTSARTSSASHEDRDIITQVQKLLLSTSTQEAKLGDDKTAKQKKSKLKGFAASSKEKKAKEKEKKAKGKAAAKDQKESKSRESSFPEASSSAADADDQDGGFAVQKLNMADFLGSS
ncbi:Exocyst complex component 3, partial [Globisporangium splendens]